MRGGGGGGGGGRVGVLKEGKEAPLYDDLIHFPHNYMYVQRYARYFHGPPPL